MLTYLSLGVVPPAHPHPLPASYVPIIAFILTISIAVSSAVPVVAFSAVACAAGPYSDTATTAGVQAQAVLYAQGNVAQQGQQRHGQGKLCKLHRKIIYSINTK